MNSRDVVRIAESDHHTATAVATIGLPDGLTTIAEWAFPLGLLPILVALLDATKAIHRPSTAGTAIHYLRQAEVSSLLGIWADELPCALELKRLSDALALSDFVTRHHPAMPLVTLARQQLTDGDLIRLSAIALVIRPIEFKTDSERHWLIALRAWVFVQTVDAIRQRSRPNQYLIDVTQKLRLGIDTSEDWLTFFGSLKGPSSSLYGITRHLESVATRLLANPEIRDSKRQLLLSLKNYCSGKSSSRDTDDSAEYGKFAQFIHLPIAASAAVLRAYGPPPTTEAPIPDEVDDASARLAAWDFEAPGSEESTLFVATVDELQNPPAQDLHATGILLGTAEDHQYLPYSWNRPSAAELEHLKRWIDSGLKSNALQMQALTAFAELAASTANSLETVLPLPLAQVPELDWTLNLEQGHLQRLAPRRANGWKATSSSENWILPQSGPLLIPLQRGLLDILRHLASEAPGSTQLGHLWPKAFADSPANYFNNLCRQTPGMERLRSGMLAQVLEQQVFQQTGDSVLSQLLASHPRSGLSGACAYASYRSDLVLSLLSKGTPFVPTALTTSDFGANAAGSELCPLDEALKRACEEAKGKVEKLALDPVDWERHHNAVTAYVLVVLLAATGARPVNSPFESLISFDWETCSIYIADKVSSRLRQGRLVPLPPWVLVLMKEYYLPHLERLATLLQKIDSGLSQALALTARNQPNGQLPLFFLLKADPTLRWLEVSESSLAALEIFTWPLPWNLMRHRLPTTLKRAGQNHEIIDGLMGHSDNGTSPYGPYSMRTWQDDACRITDPLARTLSPLGFELPDVPSWNPVPLEPNGPVPQKSCIDPNLSFGSASRETRRMASHRRARDQAMVEIAAFIGTRPVESLAPDQWEALSLLMLMHADGRPRTLGTLRYEALQQWLSKQWEIKGHRPRIKRRYLPALEESSPFTEASIGCKARIAAGLAAARTLALDTALSRRSLRGALALGIALLILESRVADARVISDLLENKNYRLVRFHGVYSLEHSPGLDQVSGVPVRRYAISFMAAQLLHRARRSTYKLDLRKWPASEGLDTVGAHFAVRSGLNFKEAALAFAEQVRQANMMAYPGLVAGYLNGNLVSVGLSHVDLVRTASGKAFVSQPVSEESAGEVDVDESDMYSAPSSELKDFVTWRDALMTLPSSTAPAIKDDSLLQADCFAFFQDLRATLNEELKTKTPSRRSLDTQLKSIASAYKFRVSRSCLLLGEWQRSLLWRKTKNGLIRIRSVQRYLNALSTCFQAMAYDHDLMTCDEDEVTAFYVRVMETRELVRPKHDELGEVDTASSHATDKSASDHYRSQTLAMQLLRDFHGLASREYGVPDPDWSEIDIADELLGISPGLLTEAEYFFALQQMAPEPQTASREELAQAFILLLIYRFGLRGAEATGLFRSDWVDDQTGAIVVLVRGNRERRLKTPAAQRQVPLLFLLSEHEKAIVLKWMDSWESIAIAKEDGPLFVDLKSPGVLMNGKSLRSLVSDAIKKVSRNPQLSAHHARHSFGNNVALLLFEKTEMLWLHSLELGQLTPERRSHARKLLLCTNEVTRRSLWAIARLMGHAHPRTFVRTYLHLLPELSARHVDLPTPSANAKLKDSSPHFTDLDEWVEDSGYLQMEPAKSHSLPPRTAQEALRFLHLCSRALPPDRARELVGISAHYAEHLIAAVKDIDAILATRKAINNPNLGPYNLLSHISESRWSALTTLAHQVASAPEKSAVINMQFFGDLSHIIGPSRQLLLWREDHFSLFEQFVSAWQIKHVSYRFASSRKRVRTILDLAKNAGLSEHQQSKLTLELDGAESPTQIDPVVIGPPVSIIQNRCAVLANTDPQSDLRSSYELVLLFMVWVVMRRLELAEKAA